MRPVFEVRRYDAAGRLGELEVPGAGETVETPALLPVVNPHVGTIPPRRLAEEFGASMLITNAYVLHGSDDLREPALADGLRELLDFPGPVMTDSGSFQLAEYGEIDVDTEEIVGFQREIGSDVGTPVDIPTPPGADRERAAADLAETRRRIETAAGMETGEMLLTAPIQGGAYPDLRERAAREAAASGGDLFPIGAVVPLLNDYRFAEVVEVVAGVKRGLPESAPVHLFGAGHPMMFALAVAMGCDLFDSAAYALYARDDRYLTVRGTAHLDELEQFPCACPVCTAHTPADLRERAERDRGDRLAEHNLYVSFAEMRRVKQALREGNLLELVEARARGHPAMTDGYRALLDDADRLRETDPVSKDTLFHLSADSARRPEIRRHHDRLERLDTPETIVLDARRDGSVPEPGSTGGAGADERWPVRPPFGPLPPALAEAYPLTAQRPDRLQVQAYEAAADGIARLAATHSGAELRLLHPGWPAAALQRLPDAVTAERRESGDGGDE
ncbi:MAG: tRNA guanosine(15) transglycosylase TgtA [Salinirussus sp.]